MADSRGSPVLSFPWVLLAALLVGGAAQGQLQPSAPASSVTAPANASGGINLPEHRDKPHLILISFDGFRADYLDRYELPNVRRVLRKGVRARSMMPVFPAVTFTNHYSLVTGLYAEHHGIVGNVFYDPARKATYSFRDQKTVTDGSWYRGEPIWVTAETQGMVAACFFWPGSEAAIKGVRPTFWNTYDSNVPNSTRVESVLNWLRMPDETRPHVITMYFNDLDSASHGGTLDAPEIGQALESLDKTLGVLLGGIEALPIRERVYVLLTSDHGMTETSASRTVLIGSLVDAKTVRVGFAGPVASLHVTGGEEQAIKTRDQANEQLKNGRAYLRAELPERFHYRADPRGGDVVIVMDESWTAETSIISKLRILGPWGEHGWDPALQSMRALFAIGGPGLKEGITIPEVNNVDVYPLMTELLGLRAAEGIDGRAGAIRRLIMRD
jgi:predicted AlkP superfamily pyrophosphatase or phosphodiesterase